MPPSRAMNAKSDSCEPASTAVRHALDQFTNCSAFAKPASDKILLIDLRPIFSELQQVKHRAAKKLRCNSLQTSPVGRPSFPATTTFASFLEAGWVTARRLPLQRNRRWTFDCAKALSASTVVWA